MGKALPLIGAAAGFALAGPFGVEAATAIGAGASIGSAASSLLSSEGGGSAPAPAAPVAEKAAVMPLPDDAQIQAAQRRSVADQLTRRGRASTILTNMSNDTLG